MGRRISRGQLRKLAKTRIRILWKKAKEVAKEDPDLASDYVNTAKKIAQKARISLPQKITRRICKKCDAVLIPGRSARFRIRNNRSTHLTVTCLHCGTIRRLPVTNQT
ncbi:MAG: ribonuclease P [Candidatus Thorarchaeota archaeon]|nr:ribonuclease P [Candidatus Thorarchaeota archaeon]